MDKIICCSAEENNALKLWIAEGIEETTVFQNVESGFTIKKCLLDGEEINKKLVHIINSILNKEIYIIGRGADYEVGNDGKQKYYHLFKIKKEECTKIIETVSKYKDKDTIIEEIHDLARISDAVIFTKKVEYLLGKIELAKNNIFDDRYDKELVRQSKIFKSKMRSKAMETREKQLIWSESKLSTKHGTWVKQEWILPDGTTEIFEGVVRS